MDPNLAQKIVHEVKFQGVFDEFRKDSIADVDTKPAYLNLRQRVENAVQKFLSEQRWTPDTNKYQLRERLRRHITESGFLDVGVERIVDQVVNPKIGSVFQPRIEEIAYKYLGLPPPARREHHQMPLPPFPTPINGNALKIETVPNVPENLLPKDLEQVSPDSDKTAVLEDEKVDDEEDESPPFEPITECKSPIKVEKIESDNIKIEIKTEIGDQKNKKDMNVKTEQNSLTDPDKTKPPHRMTTPIKDECGSADGLASQESQLSQVSSETTSNQLNPSGSDPPTNLENATPANISEEAQMPKFNENSTETEGNTKKTSDLHFDIKKDGIKFEGTERKLNLLDGEQNESMHNEPPIIGSRYKTVDIEAKGAFNFAKLIKVEPCNTQEPLSSVSSQDDTSSAQLCIVEKSEQELLQTDTNSLQKALPDESTATILNNSQTKANGEKRKSKSSSTTSSSRHKKSSKSSKRSPERSHRYEDKEHRDRNSKYSDRHSDNRYSSKHHHSSAEKHSSSSKRDDKRSSSSRSESQSRNSSAKKDHRDRYDSKKYSSHRSHRSEKDNSYKSRKVAPEDNKAFSTLADDHNEIKDKMRRRKSTDSNDEDKSPSGPNGATNTRNNIKSITESASTTNTTTGNTKSNNNESSKHCKDQKQKSVSNKLSSMVVVVNEILSDPAVGFVEIETKPSCENAAQSSNLSAEESELLYFDHNEETDLQIRLSLLDEAISRCGYAYKAFDQTQLCHSNFNYIDSSKVDSMKSNNNNNNNNNNIEIEQKMKATLQVECYEYAHNKEHQTRSASLDQLAADIGALPATKRSKFDTDCGMSKENEMNEKNAIKTDIDVKKTAAPKRVDTIAKQRYASEDLYKPRPILGQRIKRRGLDA